MMVRVGAFECVTSCSVECMSLGDGGEIDEI
jgi:hypothetical protein